MSYYNIIIPIVNIVMRHDTILTVQFLYLQDIQWILYTITPSNKVDGAITNKVIDKFRHIDFFYMSNIHFSKFNNARPSFRFLRCNEGKKNLSFL